MKKLIIYHDDADGQCAAAIAARRTDGIKFDATALAPMQYGDPVPWELFEDWAYDQDELWILDYSFSKEVMEKLKVIVGQRLIWIDHHVTALRELETLSWHPLGIRTTRMAACRLTWMFCFPKQDMPKAVQYIADRDVWEFKHGDDTRCFYEYYLSLNSDDHEPLSDTWERFLIHRPNDVASEIMFGRPLFRQRRRLLRHYILRLGRPATIHGTGLTMVQLNYPGSGDVGQIAREMGYDVTWCYVDEPRAGDGKLVRTNSIYSDGKTYDCAGHAQERGGGGHVGAAGWTNEL